MPGRVRTRRQFDRLSRPSGRGQSGPVRVSYAASEDNSRVDVAFAIGRRVGNAVQRNRLRRRLRAIVDQLAPAPKPGTYLIRCGFETGNLTYDQLSENLRAALGRAGAL